MNDDWAGLSERDPFDLIREHELADRWDKTVRTLQRWRREHRGPAYLVIGGSVHYRIDDVLAFEARHRRGGEDTQ